MKNKPEDIQEKVSQVTHSHVTGISLTEIANDRYELTVHTHFATKEVTEIKRTAAKSGKVIKDRKEVVKATWNTVDTYTLCPVTVDELMQFRLSQKPGIVYKNQGKLYYGSIPATLNIAGKVSGINAHACSEQCAKVCHGCPRTSDHTVAYQLRISSATRRKFSTAVQHSWRVEKYPFVDEALETFNMTGSNDACLISCCQDYERAVKLTSPLNAKQISQKKAGLYAYVCEDFTGTRSEMLARVKATERKNHSRK